MVFHMGTGLEMVLQTGTSLKDICQSWTELWNDFPDENWTLYCQVMLGFDVRSCFTWVFLCLIHVVGLCPMNDMICMDLCLSKATWLMNEDDLCDDWKVSKNAPVRVIEEKVLCSKASIGRQRLLDRVIACFPDTCLEIGGWDTSKIAWAAWRYGEDLLLCGSSCPSWLGFVNVFLERVLWEVIIPWWWFEMACPKMKGFVHN